MNQNKEERIKQKRKEKKKRYRENKKKRRLVETSETSKYECKYVKKQVECINKNKYNCRAHSTENSIQIPDVIFYFN